MSKCDGFGLQKMLNDTPLTRDKFTSQQESDVELKGLRKMEYPDASVEDE